MSKVGKVCGTTTELCEKLRKDGIEGVNLHELLMEWEFTQKSVRLPIGPRRAWELSDVRLATLERELSDGHQDGTPLYPSQTGVIAASTHCPSIVASGVCRVRNTLIGSVSDGKR